MEVNMKIVFPHMGNAYIAVKALLDTIGLDYIIPPRCNRANMERGSQVSPEFICLPFKTIIGDFIYGLENGADVILFGGGCGQCRLGYYGDLINEILRDMGYKYTYIHLDLSNITFKGVLEQLSPIIGDKDKNKVFLGVTLAAKTVFAMDKLNEFAGHTRCREREKGATDKIMRRFYAQVIHRQGYRDIARQINKAHKELSWLTLNKTGKPLKIAIIGEIFISSEPFTNLEIEEKLGNMGAEVYNYTSVAMWIREHFVHGLMPMKPKNKAVEAGMELIHADDVGGHGIYTIGNAVLSSNGEFDGIIQIYPLTCMPEIIAQSTFGEIQHSYGVPIMTLILDEMTGEAGYMTRLEAFVDMLEMKRESAKITV